MELGYMKTIIQQYIKKILLYFLFMIIIIGYLALDNKILSNMLNNKEQDPNLYYKTLVIMLIIFGVLISLLKLVEATSIKGVIKINIIKLLFCGLPTLAFCFWMCIPIYFGSNSYLVLHSPHKLPYPFQYILQNPITIYSLLIFLGWTLGSSFEKKTI